MLTEAQRINVRRWLGYPVLSEPDIVYSLDYLSTLTQRLDALTADEETIIIDSYLVPLAQLEAARLTASDNLDTLVAGPWTANPKELSQRTNLYETYRRDLANFLGFAPMLGGRLSVMNIRA